MNKVTVIYLALALTPEVSGFESRASPPMK